MTRLLFILFILPLFSLAQNDSLAEKKYKECIHKGDLLFSHKKWEDAKAAYQEALAYKPAAHYPKVQVIKCDDALTGPLDINQKKYADLISKADKFFAARDWKNAKLTYEDALRLKPQEAYPKSKIVQCDKLIAQEKQGKHLDSLYGHIIEKADSAFILRDFVKAKQLYTQALGYAPVMQYPKEQLMCIDQELKNMAQEKAFKDAIAQGDKEFNAKKWMNAKMAYEQALKQKDDGYAKKKIAECEEQLNIEKERTLAYMLAIKNGDENFAKKYWEAAKKFYMEALSFKPEEVYPKNQLAVCDKMIKGLPVDSTTFKYKECIAAGDMAFKNGNCSLAKVKYQEALIYKPTEKYPTIQIEECNKIIINHLDLVAQADHLYKKGDCISARAKYEEALKLQPVDQYSKDKIAEIDKSLTDAGSTCYQWKSKYKNCVVIADSLFKEKFWEKAKIKYKEALSYKPDEKYPKDQIALCDKKLKEQEENVKESNYKAAVGEGDYLMGWKKYELAKKAYQQALKYKPNEEYPKKKIQEIDKILEQ